MTITGRKRHLAVLAFGFAASLAVYSHAFGPYITWDGEPRSAELLTLFLLPLTATVIYALLGSLRSRSATASDSPVADAAIDSIVWCVLLFLISVHVIVLAVLLRIDAVQVWASRGVVVLVGLTLVAVGNLLPRTRPNVALGIRTERTLTNRQLWILTHRVAGYVAVSVGCVTVVSGLLLDRDRAAALPGIAFIIGAGVLAVCYWRFSRSSTSTSQV